MTTDMDASNADEYYVTALQIFDYCGAEGSATLRVDALMDKFAPFIKTNKSEYSFLKSLLDPEQVNPEINVSKLAKALNKYSENQKSKVDLDESFNLRCGQAPQDSDSGISTDGFQMLEDLQCELREKAHLAHQLRSQLDFTDRQHEEALATITAERDSLRAHLNMLREENATLTSVRRDYEEACERVLAAERALHDARADLDALRKRSRGLAEQLAELETEKLTLQELLTQSKDECHRINEMYASRQSALLEENETLRAEHADLSARLQDQDEFMQQLIKDKVFLEMEMKDILNKSNQTHLRLDRSIDVSYTEDQMLTALDSLNADTRFSQDNRLLDEESFVNALKEDQGRATNLSLFDEIRLSFSTNVPRPNFTDVSQCDKCKDCLDNSTGAQTDSEVDENELNWDRNKSNVSTQTDYNELKCDRNKSYITASTQTSEVIPNCDKNKSRINADTQTDENELNRDRNKSNVSTQTDYNELKCDRNKSYVIASTQTSEVKPYCDINKSRINADTQTDENELKVYINKTQIVAATQTNHTEAQSCTVHTQTDDMFNNNSIEACIDCKKHSECNKMKIYVAKLESDVEHSQRIVKEAQSEVDRCEDSLKVLEQLISDSNDRNSFLQAAVDSLQAKIVLLEAACSNQRELIASLDCEMCSAECQTESDVVSVSTQVEVPCVECEKRKEVVPHRALRKFFWEPLKSLFQVFAVVCFVAAVCALYRAVTPRGGRGAGRCGGGAVPWRWLDAQDLLDLLLRIEYVADVPM